MIHTYEGVERRPNGHGAQRTFLAVAVDGILDTDIGVESLTHAAT